MATDTIEEPAERNISVWEEQGAESAWDEKAGPESTAQELSALNLKLIVWFCIVVLLTGSFCILRITSDNPWTLNATWHTGTMS